MKSTYIEALILTSLYMIAGTIFCFKWFSIESVSAQLVFFPAQLFFKPFLNTDNVMQDYILAGFSLYFMWAAFIIYLNAIKKMLKWTTYE